MSFKFMCNSNSTDSKLQPNSVHCWRGGTQYARHHFVYAFVESIVLNVDEKFVQPSTEMDTTRKLGMNDNNSTIENRATKEPIKTNGNGQLQNGLPTTTPVVPMKPSRYMIHGKTTATQMDPTAVKPATPSLPNSAQNGNAAPVVDKAEVFENDEIEFLLEEIRDLEIPACRSDSEREDFEIAGSRADLDLSLHLDSPVDTSWYYFSILYRFAFEFRIWRFHKH